jgi:uncharacterized membrane protein YjjB (DUF3815 family)
VNLLAELLRNAVLAAIPAVGFGMSFNVPVRILGWCALGGAVGRSARFLLVTAGLSVPWATLLSAAAVSWLGVWAAKRLHAHPKVFTVAAVIPMVPGLPIFRALSALSQIERRGLTDELLSRAITSGLDASFIVGARAVGLAVPGLFVFRRKPVV